MSPISINGDHLLIPVISYSCLLPIMPDEERQQLYQGIARYFGIERPVCRRFFRPSPVFPVSFYV